MPDDSAAKPVRVVLNLLPSDREALEKLANDNVRTLSGQVTYWIRQSGVGQQPV